MDFSMKVNGIGMILAVIESLPERQSGVSVLNGDK